MNKKPLLSVIIPSYNEQDNLRRGVLEEVYTYLKDKDYSWEVIISDDGSTDKSKEIIKDFVEKHKNFRLFENPHAGKPYAIKSGINKAKGKYLLFTDMDQSTPIREIEKLLPYTKEGYKVVIGSRGAFRKDAPLYRKLAAVIFQLARRSILLPKIVDTQCGFKLLEKSLARDIFSKMQLFKRDEEAEGWKVTAYDVEMLHIARAMNEEVKEIKVLWQDEDVAEGKDRKSVV